MLINCLEVGENDFLLFKLWFLNNKKKLFNGNTWVKFDKGINFIVIEFYTIFY